MITADNIVVDSDEGRFTIRVQGDEGEVIIIDIHSVALDFYAQVRREMDDYADDAALARAEHKHARQFPQPIYTQVASIEDAIDTGYALDDPKSPGYHDRMVD